MKRVMTFVVMLLCLSAAVAVKADSSRVEPNAKVFIEPTEDGMHTALAAAFRAKKTPVIVVGDKEKADYVVSVVGEVKKAGWAKTIFAGDSRSSASMSMSVMHRESTAIVYAYNVDKGSANRGLQSVAEACAKHFKNHVDGKE